MTQQKQHKDFYLLEKAMISHADRIETLRMENAEGSENQIATLREKIRKEWEKLYPSLMPMHFVQIARHPRRPLTLDYISRMTTDFMELHGDRRAGDDPAIVSGFAFYHGQTVCLIGHQKGKTTRERLERNFGQPNPEGYRKAFRVMKLAEKFGFPVITLIDTQGAFPGLEAEEKGQAEAIAFNLREIAKLKVPVVNVVIGEGGSGGALAVGVGDRLLMLQYAYYSVITPEGCAAILWKDQSAVSQAAENLKFLAGDLKKLGVVDEVIPEPPGGAHMDPELAIDNVDRSLLKTLESLQKKSTDQLLEDRYGKYRGIGVFEER
jgi:acetyl-CoA carboxylase carboxyl transferase subunit alpha